MKNFQTVVQELLHNHERQRRYIALLTALCMLMAFTVSIILIEPAESMTGKLACGMTEHIHSEDCFTYTCGLENDASHVHSADCRTLTCGKTEHAHSENCYIHEDEQTAQIMQINSPQFIDNGMPEGDSPSGDGAQPKAAVDEKTSFESAPADESELPENALEIQGNQITISDLKIDGEEVKGDNNQYHYSTDKDKASVEFNLKYHIDSVTGFSGYLYYQLPEGIVPDNGFYGPDRVVLGDDNKEIGHFAINENGFVSIHFNQSFIDAVNSGDGTIDGYVKFQGSVSRNNTADGNRDLQIGNDEIIIDFPDKSFSVTKSGQAVVPDKVGDRPKVKWTVTVHDLAKADDKNVLDDYYLYDELFEGATNVKIILDDSYEHPDDAVTYDAENKRYKFSGNFEGDVTFTFEKELTDAEYNEFVAGKTTTKNNVYLKDTENKTVSEDEATVTFENKVTMQKAGTADYVGEYIQWTVDVSRSLNQSLKDYQVQDDAIAKSEEIVVTSGDKTLEKDKDYTIVGDTITFNNDFADVKITYKQKRDTFKDKLNKENASGSIDNVANLIPPAGKPTTENPVKGNVSWNEQLNLTKDGTYDRFNDKIDWKIKISSGSNKYSLNNYTITDEALKNVDLSKVNVKDIVYGYNNNYGFEILKQTETEIVIGKHESHWEDGKNITEEVQYFRITKENDTLKFEEIKNYDGPRELTISYSTEVTPDMKQDANGTDESKKVVTNRATDSKGHEVTGTVGIEPKSTVTKILNGETSKIEYDENTNTETLHWQVDLTQDLGFDDQEFTDVMIVADNDGLSHYIAKGQRDISVEYEKSDGSFDPLPTDNYEITFYKEITGEETIEKDAEENAKRFKITFKGGDTSKYRHIRITYETTADIEKLTEDHSATFRNSATFDGNTQEPECKIEKKDKDKPPTHQLKVVKDWDKKIAEANRSAIKFYLQRTLDNPITESTTWETYKNDGTWVSGITDFSNDYLTTLNAPNWETTFTDLEEHEKGYPENKYTYRVTEILTNEQKEIFESNVTNNDFKLTGDGQITIENSKKPDFEKIVDIEGAEDGKISVDKLLSDDEYYYIPYKIIPSDFPESTRILIKDIIPDGFELAYVDGGEDWTNPEYDINKHHPYAQKNSNSSNRAYMMFDSNVSEGGTNNQGRHFNYFSENEGDKDVKVALFCVDSDEQVWYQIKIKKSDLKEKLSGKNEFTITNTATVGEKTKPVTVTITGEVEQTAPEDETLLKKDVLRPEGSTQEYIKSNNGVIEYYVYVNPEGKKLSNTDSFDVVDDFTLNSMTSGDTTYTAEQLREMLETGLIEINVEEISDFKQDSDGNITCTTGRKIDNFTYTVEENPNTTTKKDVTKNFSLDDSGTAGFSFDVDLKAGNTIIIEIDNAETIPEGFTRWRYSWESLDKAWQSGNDDNSMLGNQLKKEGDKYVATLTVPEDAKGFWLVNLGWGGTVSASFSGKITLKDKVTINYESSSRLTITVPDETPLKITYHYEVTQDGNTMNTDTRFNASNKVSIATENASSSDELRDVTFRVNKAGAGATTGGNPSIRKFNVGTNQGVAGAKFYIAKYEEENGIGGWHFVKEVTPKTDEKGKTLHELQYSETGITNESLPAEAAYIELSGTDKYELTGDSLKSGTLYKIIEVKAPSGYQGDDAKLSGDGSLERLLKGYLADPEEFLKKPENSAYYNLVQRFVAVHYFKYNTTASASKDIPKPANFKGNIMDVKSNGTISIPNNELIDIEATKTWVGSDGTSVTFELLWSTKKQSSGIPDDATPVTALALGLIGEFESEKTIPEDGKTEATWNDLPNGLNDRPVYYYVREKSYTTSDGKVYDRQDDGTYKDSEGNEGKYKPTYTGNGLNRDGTVSVTNSNGLVIQKTWLKSNKVEMTEGEIPADKIKCRVYGKTSATAEKTFIEEITLTANDGWKYEPIGDELSKYSQYDYIIIEETEVHLTKDSTVPDKWTSVDVALYGYVRSSTSNVTDGVGTATLINRDNTPTDVDVSVEKVWSDGNDEHEGIDVKLYKSDTAISDADLANITNPESDSRLEVVTGEGITNPVTLDNSNNWKHTWNDLPFKGEGVSKYYYYAIETKVPTGYTASYFVNGNKTTITNSVPGSLTIDKKWLSTDGKDITSEIKNSADFKLYRRANSSASTDEDKKLDNLKIFAFGDSITNGVGLDNSANERYSTLLQEKLKANGTNITVDNSSQSGLRISKNDAGGGVEGYIESSNLNDSYDVVIVMAGTNNVLNTTDEIDTMKTKMSGLLDTIYSKDKNPNLVVFLEKIPRIIVEFESDRPGNRADTFSSLTLEQKQEKWNDLVTSYNNMLVQLADEYSKNYGKTIRVVDTYTAVGENFYRDSYAKIHPDKVGHQKIAELLYNEILSYYGIKGSKAPTDIKGLPSDFYKSDGSVNTDLYEEVTDKAFTLPDNGSWSKTFKDLDKKDKNGNDYVYYIVEESTGNWTAAYTGNGQTIKESGSTITLTNTVETLSLKVKKNWIGGGGNTGDTVKFNLYRTTNKENIKKYIKESDLTPNTIEIENENFDVSTGVKVIKGESFELILGTSDFEIESTPDGFTAVKNGNKITITPNGNEGDNGQLVVIDVYGNKLTIPLEIIKEPDLSLTIPDTLVEGETAEVKAMIGSKEVNPSYSFDPDDIVSIDGNIITALKAGEVTITATSGDKTTERKLTVNPWELTPNSENIEVEVGNSITIQSNKTITNATSSSDNVIVGYDDKILTIRGNTVGDAKITVTAGNKTKTITVNVVESAELKILKDGVDVTETEITIKKGATVEFTTNKKIKEVHIDNDWFVKLSTQTDNTFSLYGNATTGMGQWDKKTVTITDTDNKAKTIYVYVVDSIPLVVSPSNPQLLHGESVELTSNYDDVVYSITSGDNIITLDDNRVTAGDTDGTATIKAVSEEAGEDITITIRVVKEIVIDKFPINFNAGSSGSQIPINYNTSKTIEQIKVSLEHQENKYEYVHILINGETLVNFGRNNGGIVDVTDVTSIQGISYVTGDDCIIITPSSDFVWESLVIKSNTSDPVNGNVEITYASESATSISLASLSEPVLMSAEPTWTSQSDGTEMWSEEYIISSSGGTWETTIPNLPLKDASGKTYYYWVVETNNDGFTKTYRFNDADATQDLAINAQSPGDGKITITNTKKESSTTTMPSTGGNGAKRYYTVGGMLLLMSACGWAMHRRKRVIPH